MWIKCQEYKTKLDSYFYDNNLSTTIVVLRIRNKRALCQISIEELLNNKQILSALHPIDLCIVGVLASTSIKFSENQPYKLVPAPDNFSMIKLPPIIEIVSRNYSGEEEIITLRLKSVNRKIQITVPIH